MSSPQPSAPLTITVHGISTLQQRAERAVMFIGVSSDETSQSLVSENVTRASNKLQEHFRGLSETTFENMEAPITEWTMGAFSTGSYQRYGRDGEQLPRRYTASTVFDVRFRDFSRLGEVATDLSQMEHVGIRSIGWRLTEATSAELESKSRKDAVKDAIAKATDYAEAAGRAGLVPVEIKDEQGPPGLGYGAGVVRQMRARDAANISEELSFTPEDVSVESRVVVKFAAD